MTDITQTLTLGQQLKTAREALNLSITDVAQTTNLKKAHLEAIEDDIFILPNVPPTFMRGYVRNYVRFLRLPETLIDTVNYGEVTIPKEVRRSVSAPIAVKNNQKSQTRWVKGLTWLILLSAIGMTLAWWWQEHKKDQANSAQLVSSAINVDVAQSEITQSENNLVLSSDSVSQEIAIVPSTENTATAVSVEANTGSNNEITQPAMDSAIAVQPEAEKVEIKPTLAPEMPNVVEPVNVLQQAENNAVDNSQTEKQPLAVSNDELRIEITNATSWITVRGLKNKKLAEKLYNVGDVLTFNGNEQYRLTVGAPANVKIYYKGQQVPLKVDGRVARFKLPLAN